MLLMGPLWPHPALRAEEQERIITIAPALTEIVFALGKGDRIVGNTKFCNYPEAAKKIPRIGGFVDVNLEILISKKPTIVFLYKENYGKLKVLEGRTRLVVVRHTNLPDIYDGIETIAAELKVKERGRQLVDSIKNRLHKIKRNAAGQARPKTLLIIGRNRDKLSSMYIIGRNDFLTELIEIAGGVNAYGGDINYPSVSIESVVAMNPDVIFELSAHNEGIKKERIFKQWNTFPFISAVKTRKIEIIREQVWLIPGPRVIQIAEKMQQLFYEPLAR
jgi:iron complex transport system substrate-binding protein